MVVVVVVAPEVRVQVETQVRQLAGRREPVVVALGLMGRQRRQLVTQLRPSVVEAVVLPHQAPLHESEVMVVAVLSKLRMKGPPQL